MQYIMLSYHLYDVYCVNEKLPLRYNCNPRFWSRFSTQNKSGNLFSTIVNCIACSYNYTIL